jgi:phosphate transport system permease protein
MQTPLTSPKMEAKPAAEGEGALMPHKAKKVSMIDPLFRMVTFAAATMLLALLGGIIVSLLIGGWPAFAAAGFGFFTSTEWNPVTEKFGAAGPIVGTLITAFLALLMSLPIAIGVSVYLTQFAPAPIARPLAIAVELLAGIPSIVFGIWGLFVFAPFFAEHVQIPLTRAFPPETDIGRFIAGVPNGANIFTASVILAIMILPYMAAVFRDLFLSIPPQVREAAFGVGATPLEVVTKVLIPYVRQGMVGVVMLGFGRALGETMAVTFVIGNSMNYPNSLFSSGATLASTIANQFAEASGEMHRASLIALGLVLFIITFLVLAVARLLLRAPTHS